MSTADKLKKAAEKIRKEASAQNRIKCAHIMQGMLALKRYERLLNS